MSSFRAETRKETGGCGVWPEFKHRQQWKLRKDGVTYENTGRHEERNARWMDIFFDLVLAGQSLRCAELSLKNQREPELTYDLCKHWMFVIASFGSCISVWAHITNHRNRYHLANGSSWNTAIIAFVIALIAYEISEMEHCVEKLQCTNPTGTCNKLFLTNAVKFLFLGMVSFYTATTDALMRKYNLLNGAVMLFVSAAFLVLFNLNTTNIIVSVAWASLSLLPLIAIPLGSQFLPGLNEVYQPLNTHCFLERLGLLTIAVLAILMETLFAHSCEEWGHLCKNQTVSDDYGLGYPFEKTNYKVHTFDMYATEIKLVVCLMFALFVKLGVFNIYTTSILEEQVSRSTKYDITNDARIFSAFLLATGIAILSNEMNRDSSKCPEDMNGNADKNLNEFGEIIVTVAMTLFHYANTWRSEKWTWLKTIVFFAERIGLQFGTRQLASATEGGLVNQLDPFLYVFAMLLSFCIEKHFLDLPMNYGKERDAQILVEMLQAEESVTKRTTLTH